MSYTRNQIISRLNELSADMSQLYKDGCINYIGKTSDTKEYYTEVIAKWLIDNIVLLGEIKPITRRSSYRMPGHDGIPDNPYSNREEELIAMAMKRQGEIPLVGQVLDYQTPLKNVRKTRQVKLIYLHMTAKPFVYLSLRSLTVRKQC